MTGRADCEDLEAQRGRVRRLREAKAADYEIRAAVKGLESVLRSVIIEQGALVRRLRTDRAGKSVIAEAERRLTSLKAEYLADTGAEWSEVRGEGPIFLTTNAVMGNEIIPELGETVKQLRAENILGSELVKLSNFITFLMLILQSWSPGLDPDGNPRD